MSTAELAAPGSLEPLVLAQGARACGVDGATLDRAVSLALAPDGPDGALPGWRGGAPCAGLPAAEFYPSRGAGSRRLKALCAACPVKAPCLGSALFHGEHDGWWGGTSGNARRRLRAVLRDAGLMAATGEEAYIAWREDVADPPDVTPPRPARRKPWPHQRRAVAAVVEALGDGGRCQVAMATASGKTHVAMWAARALAAGHGVERVLVLLPSLALVAQTADVWASDDRWARVPRLAVCSDAGELELSATTEPSDVGAFMAGAGPRLVFATYQSYEVLVRAGVAFDLTVADEAHHLAGDVDKAFAGALRGEVPSARTLYMTATPKRFRRRGAGGADLVGMDDEQFGPRVFDFPLSDAVAAEVVADYRVIVAAVERSAFEAVAAQLPRQVDAHLLAGAIAVVRTMGADGLGSCLSFHSRVDRARTFSQLIGPVAEALGELRPPGPGWAGYMKGGTSVRIRRRLLARLGDPASWGVLANARAAGEGVDVPTLDVVAIVDPKNSEVDVMQATGRALRRPHDGKRVGTVLLPVLLTGEHDPADPLAGCDRRSIELVGGVLRALRAHDPELAGTLDRTRRHLGQAGPTRADFGALLRRRAARGLLQSRVQFRVPGDATGALTSAMALHMVREAAPAWEEAYGRLLAYVGQHGAVPGQATKVADETGTFSLGAWVSVQRQLHRRGLLSPERAEALEAVDCWSWLPREEGWWAKYEALRDFMVTHGRDPKMAGATGGYEWWKGVNVGQFLNVCRQAIGDKDGHWLEQFPDRMAALESIPGWRWSTKDADWDLSFSRLERYVAVHGHAAPRGSEHLVGDHMVDGQHMGRWVQKQRARIRAGTLRADRAARLRALPGWVDSYEGSADEAWDRMYLYLSLYVRTYRRLPGRHDTWAGANVGAWVTTQRAAVEGGSRPRSNMSAERVRRLEAIPGWRWTRRAVEARPG